MNNDVTTLTLSTMLAPDITNKETRRYPWGIQQLVSTHQLPHKSGGGSPDQLKSQNPKCQDLPKFSLGGGVYSRPTQIRSAKICPNFHFPGTGVVLQTNIPEILE